MKPFLFAVLLLALAAPARTDDLVATAKAAKAKRKKSTTKVITNADVKRSKGKVIENGTLPPLDETPGPGMLEMHEAAMKARHANAEKVAAAEKTIAGLESELRAIERAYFEENDATVRDRDVVRRFKDTKAKLDAARQELAALIPPPANPPANP
jgi:hypothetical protein